MSYLNMLLMLALLLKNFQRTEGQVKGQFVQIVQFAQDIRHTARNP